MEAVGYCTEAGMDRLGEGGEADTEAMAVRVLLTDLCDTMGD